MKLHCPSIQCQPNLHAGPNQRQIIRKGYFFRSSDSRYVTRYQCKSCRRNFSNATGRSNVFQKKRRITKTLFELLNSGVSQRRCALLLNINRKTVARRLRYLAKIERARHQMWLQEEFKNRRLSHIQFDDLETSEHTKCKPLSVALAIDPKTRKILSFQVNSMPARGHLAKISRKKYGLRRDERYKGWNQLMKELKNIASDEAIFRSDSNPHYPKYLFKHHPSARHETSLGGRGAVTGQGELKKLRFDPLFALNHTCAMSRANVNRLFRRTWCTTKNKQGLIDHLSLYVGYHNRMLTE